MHNLKNANKEDEYLECDNCGKKDETVEDTICPYEDEINHHKIDVTLCESCYHERSCEI
mgnify:CR=1 FL=1